MARLIAVMGTVSRDRDTLAALHLVYPLAVRLLCPGSVAVIGLRGRSGIASS